jgi:membrane protein
MSDGDIGESESAATPSATAQPDTTPRPSRALGRTTAAAQRTTAAAQRRYSGSSAEHLWTRLAAMDFINRGMIFAATLLLCFFPFLIIANALAGQSAASGLARHLGLNKQAAADVGQLFTSSTATSNAVTGTAWLFFILGGIAAATAIQQLYERAFDLDTRGMKDLLRRLMWLVVLVGCSALAGWAGPGLRDAGGPVLLGVLGLVVLTAFWWFTMWFLLAGRVSWRGLFPAAVATAVCWLGMEVVFSIIFSNTIISDDKKYGPIGVVFALMSWLIAIGVVIILGAVAGIVWDERKLSLLGPFKKLMRRRSRAS